MSIEVWIAEGCRWYVSIALLVAAIGKSLHLDGFRDSLSDLFPRLGAGVLSAVAFVILAGEWSAGLLLLIGGGVLQVGLILALLLLVSLTVGVVWVLAQGLSVRCNCFGASRQRISGFDLVRNLLFIAAAGYALRLGTGYDAMDAATRVPWLAVVPIVAVAVALFQLSVSLRAIAQLLQIRADAL